MPLDSTPRISRLSILNPSLISLLGNATGTTAPTSKFQAPQTISYVFEPTSTLVTRTLSAFGCSYISNTLPTVIFL